MYSGKEDRITAEHLASGETCIVTGYGNSMTPKLKSGESVIMEPVGEDTILEKVPEEIPRRPGNNEKLDYKN